MNSTNIHNIVSAETSVRHYFPGNDDPAARKAGWVTIVLQSKATYTEQESCHEIILFANDIEDFVQTLKTQLEISSLVKGNPK